MKKIYIFLAFVLAALVFPVTLQAQTDVTATHLTNANFNSNANFKFDSPASNLGSANGGANIQEIEGWSRGQMGDNSAASTFEYGYTGTLNLSGTSGYIPAQGPNGETGSGHAALGVSAAWTATVTYTQNVTLAPGRYSIKYTAINTGPNANSLSRVGWVPNSGTSTIATRTSFPINEWITDTVTFTVVTETTGIIQVGIAATNTGSPNVGRIFFDHVKLLIYDVDKTDLGQLIDSATVMLNNPQDVGASPAYSDLQAAINAAQAVYDNPGATAGQVLLMEELLRDAITDVYGAILLQQRVLAWTNLPYNATEVIKNPSFEEALTVGWTNQGGFQRQTNASFDPFKAGNAYAERWVTSGTTLSNLRLSQEIKNIPNGVYLLTVAAHAMQQADGGSYPGGAYIVANDDFVEVFERKEYNLTVEVEENVLIIAFEVAETGNWVAVDNFRLTYISDGSAYIVSDPKDISFSPSVTEKTINLTGGNLTENVTVSAPASFTLSKTSFTPAELTGWGGVDLTITYTGSSAIAKDSLVFSHGDTKLAVYVSVKETLSASNGGFLLDQSLVPIKNFTVTGDVYGPITLTVPAGVSLDVSSITPAEAAEGRGVVMMWDYETLVEDKFIYITSGSVKDSILVFATPNNLIASWDGDDAEGEGSRLTDFGWTLTEADGITPVSASFNLYEATSGIRYVPLTNQNYTYLGKPWNGHRVAYLRTWGNPPTNVYNLPVELTEGKTYRFRGVAAWHDNETNPTFKYAVNTMQANLGDTLGIDSVQHTVRRRGHDYIFTFKAKTTGTHYVTVSSSVVNDVMSAPFFLSVYETKDVTSTEVISENSVRVYPTVSRGFVNIDTAGETGMVRVFDLTGKHITSKVLGGSIETVSLPAEGVYILQVNAGGQMKNVKVINVK